MDLKIRMKIKKEKIIKIERIDCDEYFYDLHTEVENYIANGIITHNCSPHKKSVSTGFYMPSMTKDKTDIPIMIDMSGSISKKELTDFLSEICGIARAYQDRIDMRIFSHDTECYDNGMVRNGNIEKIMKMKIKGGGGTSHIKAFEEIKERVRDYKCCIFLTDGYSDLDSINFNDYSFGKLFIISEGGSDRQLEGKNCQIVKMENLK